MPHDPITDLTLELLRAADPEVANLIAAEASCHSVLCDNNLITIFHQPKR